MSAPIKIKWPTRAEAEQVARDEEIKNNFRILGARDGLVTALLKVRNQIKHFTYYPIDPRHVRKIADRERILAPLRTLERILDDAQKACQASFEKREDERKSRVSPTPSGITAPSEVPDA